MRLCNLSKIFLSSGIALVSIIVPIVVGMAIRFKWPKIAKKIVKVRNSSVIDLIKSICLTRCAYLFELYFILFQQ